MAQLALTATVTNGSTTVLVPGVDLRAQVDTNDIFMVVGSYVPYFVASAVSYNAGTNKSTVTLSGAYAGTTGTVKAVFATDFTTPDLIPVLSPGDVGTATIFTQAMYRIQEMLSTASPEGFAAIAQDAQDAIDSAAAALVSQNAAAASAAATADSATAAAASATTATTKATAASTSAGAAAAAATAAINAADNAAADVASAVHTDASAAAASATAADASSDLAALWASAPVNTVVANAKYSAYHWAQQAAASVTNVFVYRGPWSAASGSYPASPATGDYYKVSVAGTVSTVVYAVGDSIVYNGSGWDKITNNFTSAVTSVAGHTGVVTLAKADVGLANVDNLSAATIRAGISGANVTSALGYTPYPASNPDGYLSSVAWSIITGKPTALSAFINDSGYVTAAAITSAAIVAALGFTPLSPAGPTAVAGNFKATNYSEKRVSANVTTSTYAINLANGGVQVLSIQANTTLSIAGLPASASDSLFSFTVVTVNDGTAGRTIAWPANVRPSNGQMPPRTTTAGATDVWMLYTYDNGTSWVISLVDKNV